MFKIEFNFRKCKKKNSENFFRFWHHLIWKCLNKFPLLRREYLSSAVNGLTNSPKILCITQGDFSTCISLTGIYNYGKGAVVQLGTVFLAIYHITCQRNVWKGHLLFRHWSNHVFWSPQDQKVINRQCHLFFWKC